MTQISRVIGKRVTLHLCKKLILMSTKRLYENRKVTNF